VLAAFPREVLKNGSRAISVGTEDVNRERAELETAFPRFVIMHPEQLVYVRLSVEKGGCLAVNRIQYDFAPISRKIYQKSKAILFDT
jgi:hypothetical protein